MVSFEEITNALPLALAIILIIYLLWKFVRFITAPRYVFLIYADWCGACKEFKPLWEQLKQKPELREKIKKINLIIQQFQLP